MAQALGTTYMIDGVKVSVRPRLASAGQKEFNAKNRVYIWNLERHYVDLDIMEKSLPAPKMKGEDKENDKAYNTFNRLYAKRSREVAIEFVNKLIALGIVKFAYANAEDVTFKFSRTAGCSCPCSPGVTMDSLLREVDSYSKVDIHISF